VLNGLKPVHKEPNRFLILKLTIIMAGLYTPRC